MSINRRQNQKSYGLSWWIVLLAGTLVVVFSVAITRELFRTQQVRRQVQRLEEQVTTEEERYGKLQELIAYLGSQTYQEREARLQLGLRKSGEKVIVVPPNSIPNLNTTNGNHQSIITGQIVTDTSTPSYPQNWWHYFFGRTDSNNS